MDAQINSMVFDSCLDQVWSLFAQFVSYVQHGSNLRPSAIYHFLCTVGRTYVYLRNLRYIAYIGYQTRLQFNSYICCMTTARTAFAINLCIVIASAHIVFKCLCFAMRLPAPIVDELTCMLNRHAFTACAK